MFQRFSRQLRLRPPRLPIKRAHFNTNTNDGGASGNVNVSSPGLKLFGAVVLVGVAVTNWNLISGLRSDFETLQLQTEKGVNDVLSLMRESQGNELKDGGGATRERESELKANKSARKAWVKFMEDKYAEVDARLLAHDYILCGLSAALVAPVVECPPGATSGDPAYDRHVKGTFASWDARLLLHDRVILERFPERVLPGVKNPLPAPLDATSNSLAKI